MGTKTNRLPAFICCLFRSPAQRVLKPNCSSYSTGLAAVMGLQPTFWVPRRWPPIRELSASDHVLLALHPIGGEQVIPPQESKLHQAGICPTYRVKRSVLGEQGGSLSPWGPGEERSKAAVAEGNSWGQGSQAPFPPSHPVLTRLAGNYSSPPKVAPKTFR